jgi:hypothetical protein
MTASLDKLFVSNITDAWGCVATGDNRTGGAMRVRELLAMLRDADPDSVVLFIDRYADSDESDEVREVYIPASAWTHEHGFYANSEYEVLYPGMPEVRDEGYRDVVYKSERVIVLSAGPTNLRFEL